MDIGMDMHLLIIAFFGCFFNPDTGQRLSAGRQVRWRKYP